MLNNLLQIYFLTKFYKTAKHVSSIHLNVDFCVAISCCLFQCAKVMIQNKIISSDKDLLGIVFYGTVSLVVGHQIMLTLQLLSA